MPELITQAEACALLRISRPTLASLHKQGRLPYVRIGRHCVRILADDVARLLETSKKEEKTNA
jgi:excisionase family DNA binding protein